MKKSAWLTCVVGIAVSSSAVFASENFVTNFVTEVVDGEDGGWSETAEVGRARDGVGVAE